ncbi:hypothetical protein BDV32DRAFT_156430 [Aspergillus pseudonomiae]|uniref:Alpha/beta hydrolase fold-3 domain-containing protein n=1 Tax=Aspergillus pseudonomiae TaxID=1506151 RepID=A0A5N6HKY2_9EURO|nr:uncharacterized protein BDV37DRAFT_276007 [Aspergillus pseudonomiae]KAB8255162.1 hypothetical protein BDV32DRAFT_156430 [Aspergillus pseudonomiae]KAE8398560.1 hypothetical protein BDV37DRAFT_276007 [Aspergillus pseudonomiae]
MPLELLHRLDPVYVEHYRKDTALERVRRDVPQLWPCYRPGSIPQYWAEMSYSRSEIRVLIFEPKLTVNEQVFVVHDLNGKFVAFDTDYRLALKYRHSTDNEDCWAAFNWAIWIRVQKVEEFNIDPERMAVGGISAGNNLSAVLAHICRDAHTLLSLQILSRGRFDRANGPYVSYREVEVTPALPTAEIAYRHKHFLRMPRPARPEDVYEGEAYAEKLKAAGCRTEVMCMPEELHISPHLEDILEMGTLYNKKVIIAMEKELAG